MRDILSATQAAAVLGCGPQKVRERIRIGEWPGKIIPKAKTKKKSDTYEVNLYELAEYFHISEDEIRRRLAEKKGWKRVNL